MIVVSPVAQYHLVTATVFGPILFLCNLVSLEIHVSCIVISSGARSTWYLDPVDHASHLTSGDLLP
jgi:hypothetical protein